MAKVLIIGGDGFCGWPTSLHLSKRGHDVTIVDNFSRRRIDEKMGTDSLTPISDMPTRIAAWQDVSGETIGFANIDVASDVAELTKLLADLRPDTIIHFGEQRAAPYSMRGLTEKLYTVDNNIRGTHNLLAVIAELGLDSHVVHLGTMGVYGYDGDGLEIPEGYLKIMVPDTHSDAMFERDILYPTNPGSVYHMTKSMDQLLFQFYAKNNNMRITDLHQGIVWGTQTNETRQDLRLINRFDYDGDYGTVLNRFLMQAALAHPLTVHGTGGQTRAFIHIQDTVHCLALAVENPAPRDGKVKILNQMTETHRVRDLAHLVARIAGAEVMLVDNPRKEAAENDLKVSNKTFIRLGLEPTTLENGLLSETVDIAKAYVHRALTDTVACTSTWTPEQNPGVIQNGIVVKSHTAPAPKADRAA